MFYDGDLQSGIALAVKDSKSVACFVKGDDALSSLWENEYLQDDQIKLALSSRAVAFRILAGSQEAGFMAAYYPLPVVPAFIVIHSGQLALDLRSGEAKDSFKAAVLKTLASTSSNTLPPSTSTPIRTSNNGVPASQTSPPESRTQPSTPLANSSNPSVTSDQPTMTLQNTTPEIAARAATIHANESTAPQSASSNQSSQTIQNLLADRRWRLEKDKKEKEGAEKAERKAKADARKESMTADPDSAKAKQATYAHQQRKRQQDAKLERDRILRQIEHDKAERKEKEVQRKASAKAQAEGNDGAGGLVDQQLSSEMNRGPRSLGARDCAIQVRLFDGGIIRTKFKLDKTLRTDIRAWVDEERSDGDVPYTFKQILAPLPNRTFSISEEEESLQSLGLAPSATLVIVPVQGYTTAYGGNQGILSRGAAAGYNVVSAGAGLFTGALGTVLGRGQATVPGQEPVNRESTTQPAAPGSENTRAASGINIRTLRDQRGIQEDHQFYNGNQLNFEPRRDSDDQEG